MKLLLIYATYSGGTETASQIVAEGLKTKGHEVDVRTAADATPEVIDGYEGIVFCSPTWDFEGKEGQPHEDFLTFMEKAKDKTWEGKPFAIMALGDSSYTRFCGAADELAAFVTNAKGKLVGDPLKVDGFFFNQDENSQKIKAWSEQVGESFAA